MADSKKVHFSKSPFASINTTNLRTNPWNFCEKISRIGGFENLRFWIFFCFIPMKISQSLLVSKDGSFWSSQMWWHFLTHAKHFEGECTYYPAWHWWRNSLSAKNICNTIDISVPPTYLVLLMWLKNDPLFEIIYLVNIWPKNIQDQFSKLWVQIFEKISQSYY